MLRITSVKVLPGQEHKLAFYVAKALGVREEEIKEFHIVKKSLDARKKPELFWIFTIDVKLAANVNEKKCLKNKNVSFCTESKKYVIPNCGNQKLKNPPIVVGTGPAGLFAAYLLAQKGFCPIVLEQGEDVDTRMRSVEDFWQGKALKSNSNVQFGEGGAGTFSDGKLNTGVKDKEGRNRAVLEIFHEHGAEENILYDGKPHIGTDVLAGVVKSMRNKIISLGGQVLFGHKFVDYETNHYENGNHNVPVESDRPQENVSERNEDGHTISSVKSVRVLELKTGKEHTFETEVLILAIGHSARDTYEMLYSKGLSMEPKPFAVGVRVEHSQEFINATQYGADYKDRFGHVLPASPYKVTARAKDGRGVYSFCMCPGGYVVNASSEDGYLAVNGMSYSGRNGEHANSAIVVAVDEKDFKSDDVLAGMYFQRDLEKAAFTIGNGKIPIEFYEDFKGFVCKKDESDSNNSKNNMLGEEKFYGEKDTDLKWVHSIKGVYKFAPVHNIFPTAINQAIVEGMEQFDKTIPGFAKENPLLCGVESRTSAPVRILRDETYQSAIKGLYPCGEGAGYAGGITSAAMDGMKVAETIINQYFCKNKTFIVCN